MLKNLVAVSLAFGPRQRLLGLHRVLRRSPLQELHCSFSDSAYEQIKPGPETVELNSRVSFTSEMKHLNWGLRDLVRNHIYN